MAVRSRVVRQAGHPVLGDAYGLELLDCYEGRGRYEVVERDDGYIDTGGDVLFYFGTFPAWPAHVQEALRAVHGRVLDIGCGAGRHALYCQENGLPVVGIDNSPLAVEVCRRRGLQDVRCMSITQLSRRLGVFDTILMLGNNFGLFGSYRRAKWLLRRFDGMTSDDAMIVAETMDPYQTDNPDHLAYHELNRRRGRMSGQVRIRIRTRAVATAWFDYLCIAARNGRYRGRDWLASAAVSELVRPRLCGAPRERSVGRKGMWDALKAEAARLGKPQWRPMLSYVAALHERSTHPPRPPFPYPWEEIGPGYCYGPAFGHWDLIHQVLDTLPSAPEHARQQILNDLAAQEQDGLVPGSIYLREGTPRWSKTTGHPPVWPVAVQDYVDQTGDMSLIAACYEPLVRQIAWFEANRKAEGRGFFYTDILNHSWESGVDEGVRFLEIATGPRACVDATAHVYSLYEHGARWARLLGYDGSALQARADELRAFMQETLFDDETGFFHDIWAVGQPERRRMAFEGMFPFVVGAATMAQAQRVIDENLLNPERFFTPHPISTVGVRDPHFELRMWRGPAWNSMTLWAARGCVRYGRADAARALVEAALDDSAAQFTRTGTIWEFYHPLGGHPEDIRRKPHTAYNQPCRDYLGHNPLLAMARLWEQTADA